MTFPYFELLGCAVVILVAGWFLWHSKIQLPESIQVMFKECDCGDKNCCLRNRQRHSQGKDTANEK